MAWNQRAAAGVGAAYFRGTVQPRLGEFAFLADHGVTVRPAADDEASADLSHPQWGTARLTIPRQPLPVPRPMIVHDARLDAAERAEAVLGRSGVFVRVEGDRGDVLRDRKRLLRYLNAVMGDDGLVAFDATASRFWPRAALADELAHDADLDIDALFTVHAVTGDDDLAAEGTGTRGPACRWYHTHGLAEIGHFDFDVVRPHQSLVTGRCHDFARAVAFAVVEGKVQRSTESVRICSGGPVRLVDVAEFNRRASAADRSARDADDFHNRDRAVLCDVATGGKLRRKLLGTPARPSRLLMADQGEFMVFFPNAATELMAARARQTFGRFRALWAELAELRFKPIVKLGYRVDGGGPTDREHLWFEVHAADDDGVDATLTNAPHRVAALQMGDRGRHPLERLTDWALIGPTGMVTPRDTRPARTARAHRADILAHYAKVRSAGAA